MQTIFRLLCCLLHVVSQVVRFSFRVGGLSVSLVITALCGFQVDSIVRLSWGRFGVGGLTLLHRNLVDGRSDVFVKSLYILELFIFEFHSTILRQAKIVCGLLHLMILCAVNLWWHKRNRKRLVIDFLDELDVRVVIVSRFRICCLFIYLWDGMQVAADGHRRALDKRPCGFCEVPFLLWQVVPQRRRGILELLVALLVGRLATRP